MAAQAVLAAQAAVAALAVLAASAELAALAAAAELAALAGLPLGRAGLPGRGVGLAELPVAQIGLPGLPTVPVGLSAGETDRPPTSIGERAGRNDRDARRAAGRRPPGGRLRRAHNGTTRQANRPPSGHDLGNDARTDRAESVTGPAARAGATGPIARRADPAAGSASLPPARRVAARPANAGRTSSARHEAGSSGLLGGPMRARAGRTAVGALAVAPTAPVRPAVPTPETVATGPSVPGGTPPAASTGSARRARTSALTFLTRSPQTSWIPRS